MSRRARWMTGFFVAASASAALATLLLAPGCQNRDAAGPAATMPASRPAFTGPVATLTVRVADVRNARGKLVFGVFTSAAGFPSDQGKSIAWDVKDASDPARVFTVQLPPGTYGASVLHDENANGKMDLNLVGIPKEGYGVTNNPKPKFSAAKFSQATFTLPPQGAEVTISLQYF